MIPSEYRCHSDRALAEELAEASEIKPIMRSLAEREDVAAVLCFGLVLKGETDHDVHISRAVAQGLVRVGLDTHKPVAFGVLTCNTLGQARRRARRRDEHGLDKGREVALAVIESLHALAQARSANAEGATTKASR